MNNTEENIKKLLKELDNQIEYNGNLVTVKTGKFVAIMYTKTLNEAMRKVSNNYIDDNTIKPDNTSNNS